MSTASHLARAMRRGSVPGRTGALLWVAVLLCLAPFGPAFAQSRGPRELRGSRVVILELSRCCGPIAWPEAEVAIRKELVALGVEVERAHHKGAEPGLRLDELTEQLLDHHAQAALSIHHPGDQPAAEILLTIRPRSRGEPTSVSFQIREPKDAEGASIAALSAVEVIRAGLMEQNLQKVRLPNVEKLEARAGARRAAKPLPASVELGLAVVTLYSPLGMGWHEGLSLSFSWPLSRSLSLLLEASGIFLGPDVSMGENRASFGMASLRLLGFWHAWQPGAARLSLGLGGGMAIPWTEGTSSPDRPLQRDAGLSGEILAAVRLSLRLGPIGWLFLDLRSAQSLPEVRFRVGEKTEAWLGHPFWEAAIGAEVVLR